MRTHSHLFPRHQKMPLPHASALPPGSLGASGGGESAGDLSAPGAVDPVMTKLRPGQLLKCPVAMGRKQSHLCDVSVTMETTLEETRMLIADAVTKPLTTGYGFVTFTGESATAPQPHRCSRAHAR